MDAKRLAKDFSNASLFCCREVELKAWNKSTSYT